MSLLFAVCILAKDTEKLNCCTNYFRDNVKLIPEILVGEKTLNLVGGVPLDLFLYELCIFHVCP
jgi:hypothetical protein